MALTTDMHRAAPQPGADRELTIVRHFNAPRALVFKVWTQPEHIARWWGCSGCRSVSAKTDLRPGGEYQVDMALDGGIVHTIHGAYREIDEPEHLSFTWTWDREDGSHGSNAIVTIDLIEHASGTEMTLHQAIFDDIDECIGHHGGWTTSFDRLVVYLETV